MPPREYCNRWCLATNFRVAGDEFASGLEQAVVGPKRDNCQQAK